MGRKILLLWIVFSALSPVLWDWTMAPIAVAASKEEGLGPFKDFTSSSEKPVRFPSRNSGFYVTLHVLVFSIAYLILLAFSAWYCTVGYTVCCMFEILHSLTFLIPFQLTYPYFFFEEDQNRTNTTKLKNKPQRPHQNQPNKKTPKHLWDCDSSLFKSCCIFKESADNLELAALSTEKLECQLVSDAVKCALPVKRKM